MPDPFRIDSVAQLREIIPEPVERIREKIFEALDPVAREFIAASPLLFVATSDTDGRMDVSPKGDEPGFVHVEDDRTLLIPDRPGNKLADGHTNVLSSSRIGLIFLIPNVRETLRVNGEAELTRDPAILERLAARGRPALVATRVHVEEAFLHCGKAMIRSGVWNTATWPERFRPPIGRQLAAKSGAGSEVARTIDEAIERDYVENL